MRVYRGRAATVSADAACTRRLLERGAPALRVWRPHRQVAFGPRDARADGYDRARRAAADRGFPARERAVGGRAVAYTGSTVAFARVEPLEDPRAGLRERYVAAGEDLRAALADLGVAARPGEPAGAFCPGSHSLQAQGKVAGLAQRVVRGAAVVAGVVVVRDHREIAAVLDPVYAALGLAFDPSAVGSLARAGGPADPDRVLATIEDALVGERPARVTRVRET